MRVLVTGGAGFIGSHVVDALSAAGHEPVVLDAFDDAYDPALKERNLASFGGRVVRGDVRDAGLVAELAWDCDAVVHMAARAGVRESLADPLLFESVNVAGTAALLEGLRRAGAPPLVFASSSSVYGARERGPFSEDLPADRPVSPYAATKRAGELLCHAAHAGWGQRVLCLRFFTVYGPRQRPAMAISRFVRGALGGEAVPLFGDGRSARDYTFVEDAVEAVLRALSANFAFDVLNVGSGRPVRLDALVEAVGRAVGRPVPVVRRPPQPGDVPLTFADLRRVEAVLGWRPRTSLEEGLRRTVEWFRARA